jgi:sugar O-acyltransferase (sialic acid O-acetyltransferase NeuD family)
VNFNNNKFFIWGARGHALVLAEIIHSKGDEIIAIADIDPKAISPIKGLNVIIGHEAYNAWLKNIKLELNTLKTKVSAIAAIGGTRGKDRFEYLRLFKRDGFNTPSLIHHSSHLSVGATIGENTQLCAFSFVGVNSVLGDACIINTKAILDHESTLGNGVHLAPGATICGCVKIGNFSFIGAGATVLPNIEIGDNCIIGAGSVVTKNLPNNILAYGNPAKIIKEI